MEKTVFEKIIDRELPAEIIFENKDLIVIKDKYPVAPVHLLIIPKKHYQTLNDVPEEDMLIIKEVFVVAKQMAEKFLINESGYRVLVNCGPEGGQEIYHLHFHLLGGGFLNSL